MGVVLAIVLLVVTIGSTVGIATFVNGHLVTGSASRDSASPGTASADTQDSIGPKAPRQPTGAPTQASHGFVPDGTSLSPTDDVPAITNLNGALLKAVRLAFDAAAKEGNPLPINSGWRSLALQELLLDQATTQYGSREEALKWVSTPQLSHHTKGDAVDVGPLGNVAWLDSYGYRYGLCRIYDNEPWHFELATTPGDSCPPRLPSAAAAGA